MDTNVLVAGLRSQRGASNQLLQSLRAGQWTLVLSNTTLGEYHEVLHRQAEAFGMSHGDADLYLGRALRAGRATHSEYPRGSPPPRTRTTSRLCNWRGKPKSDIL